MRLFLYVVVLCWPQFRGPGGSGVAPERANPPLEFGLTQQMRWKIDVPTGHASPVVWESAVYLAAFNAPAQRLEVLCVNRADGKIRWRRNVAAPAIETTHEISNPATATPAVDEKRVYAYFGSYGLIAFDHDGNQQWSLPLDVVKVPYGSGTSPILAGNRLILSRDEGSTPYLLAVEKDTGKIAWKQPQYGAPVGARTFNASTPCVWKDEIVMHHRNEVVGFDLATGARKWWLSASTQGTGSPGGGPDAVYAPTWFNDGEPDLRLPLPNFDELLKRADKNGDGVVRRNEFPETFALAHRIDLDSVRGATQSIPGSDLFQYADQNRDGKVERAEWERVLEAFKPSSREHGLLAIRPGGAGNVSPKNILWKESRGVPEVPTPLVYKNRVYTVTNGGTVSCMNANTGQLIFRERLGAPGGYFASPIAAGDRVYFTSGDGVITVIASGDQWRVLARNQIGEPLFATPAIDGDSIYVRSTTSLYAFGK